MLVHLAAKFCLSPQRWLSSGHPDPRARSCFVCNETTRAQFSISGCGLCLVLWKSLSTTIPAIYFAVHGTVCALIYVPSRKVSTFTSGAWLVCEYRPWRSGFQVNVGCGSAQGAIGECYMRWLGRISNPCSAETVGAELHRAVWCRMTSKEIAESCKSCYCWGEQCSTTLRLYRSANHSEDEEDCWVRKLEGLAKCYGKMSFYSGATGNLVYFYFLHFYRKRTVCSVLWLIGFAAFT